MTRNQLSNLFDTHQHEFLKFDRITERLSDRRDLHAMILMSQLFESTNPTVLSDADHDVVFFSAKIDEVCAVASTDDIIDLMRCGVIYDTHKDTLKMFV